MGMQVDAVLSEMVAAGAAQRKAHEAEREAFDTKLAAIHEEQMRLFERHNKEANDHNAGFQKKLDAALNAEQAADRAAEAAAGGLALAGRARAV